MRLQRHVLADETTKLPMPDRGGRLFSADQSPEGGEMIDVEHPFWAARIRDKEILPASNAEAATAPARNRKGK